MSLLYLVKNFALGSDIVKYVEVLDRGLEGSKAGTTDNIAVDPVSLKSII